MCRSGADFPHRAHGIFRCYSGDILVLFGLLNMSDLRNAPGGPGHAGTAVLRWMAQPQNTVVTG
jgi:hypothetical protein